MSGLIETSIRARKQVTEPADATGLFKEQAGIMSTAEPLGQTETTQTARM